MTEKQWTIEEKLILAKKVTSVVLGDDGNFIVYYNNSIVFDNINS